MAGYYKYQRKRSDTGNGVMRAVTAARERRRHPGGARWCRGPTLRPQVEPHSSPADPLPVSAQRWQTRLRCLPQAPHQGLGRDPSRLVRAHAGLLGRAHPVV